MGGPRKNKPALTRHRGRLSGTHACILFHTNLHLTSYANKSLPVLSTLLKTEGEFGRLDNIARPAGHGIATEFKGFKKWNIKQARMAHTAHKTRETASKKSNPSLEEKKEKKYLGIWYVIMITSVPHGQRNSIWSLENISQGSERHESNVPLQPQHQPNREHGRDLPPLWLGKAPCTHTLHECGAFAW